MRIALIIVFCAALTGALAAAAPLAAKETEKERKDELLTLYLLAVAADRCGFAMTPRQADIIENKTKSLIDGLKLRPRHANELYSEADVVFERQGPQACDRNGSFAKMFRDNLEKLTGR